MTKSELREQMLARRMAISGAIRLEASAAIANHFADHPFLTYAASFAGYYPFRGEIDVLPIFNRMARFNKRMALPRTEGDSLTFREWTPGQTLESGAYGIKCSAEAAPALIPEVILVPLLAFDSAGFRLGYGGGYYDRTITALRQTAKPPLCIGVAFAMQEVTMLPLEPHDQPLDGILTEEGVSMFS